MTPRKNRKPVKTKIPWELYMAIVRLQGEEDLDWDQACIRTAELIDVKREEFLRTVDVEADRKYKSRHMKELNRSRKSWTEKGYAKGVEEYCIVYPCSVCGGDLIMKPRAKDHEVMKGMMKRAGWAHSTCLKK